MILTLKPFVISILLTSFKKLLSSICTDSRVVDFPSWLQRFTSLSFFHPLAIYPLDGMFYFFSIWLKTMCLIRNIYGSSPWGGPLGAITANDNLKMLFLAVLTNKNAKSLKKDILEKQTSEEILGIFQREAQEALWKSNLAVNFLLLKLLIDCTLNTSFLKGKLLTFAMSISLHSGVLPDWTLPTS